MSPSPSGGVTLRLIVLVVFFIVLTSVTYQRNTLWKDEIILWEDVVKKARSKARAYYNLGHSFADEGMADEAIHYYLIALQIKPDYVDVHNNLALVYNKRGLTDKAMEHLEITLTINPDLSEAHFNLGVLYLGMKRFNEAERELTLTLRINPYHSEAGQFLNYMSRLKNQERLR